MSFKEKLEEIFGKKVTIKNIAPVKGEDGLVNIHIDLDGNPLKIRKSTGWEDSLPQDKNEPSKD